MATTVEIKAAKAHKIHPFTGFGAQFNCNVFGTKKQPRLRGNQEEELAAAIGNLKPGHSRIFFDKSLAAVDRPTGPMFDALEKTIALAQRTGANVNLTYWQGPYANVAKLRALNWRDPNLAKWPRDREKRGEFKWPDALTEGTLKEPRARMRRFARFIRDSRAAGNTCITHVTIQNEVNSDAADIAKHGSKLLNMRLYEWLYRLLDRELRELPDPLDPKKTMREAVDLVGGDLVDDNRRSPQNDWLGYLHDNMDVSRPLFPGVIDGYSIHVYWEPGSGVTGFPAKLEARLGKLAATLAAIGIDKPVFVTEYGVKRNGLPRGPEPGGPGSGKKMEFSPEVAFQHAWFNAVAPQLGCAGLAKWVLYRTDKPEGFGEYGMVDAPNARGPGRTPFGRSPAYRMTRLFNHLVEARWKAAGLGRSARGSVLASRFDGPGQHSIVVLNGEKAPVDVLVRGVKNGASYFAADWNRDGQGGLMPLPRVAAAGGVARVTVPAMGIAGLSTRKLGL